MTDTAVAEREEQASNLPAEREQHPIIAAIDARMDEIGGILPDGMKPERFRKVVVQAMLRNPDLWNCTPISIVTAITEAAEVGIEPTGVLGKGWLIPYKNNGVKEAKFIPGWRGFVDLLWRSDRILLTVDVVRAGDEFSYRRGTDQYLHHLPALDDPERESDAANITYAYVIARLPDGREEFDVMSRVDLERIRDKAKFKNPVWVSDFPEMCKKTPVRRIAKRLPLSPAAQAMLADDEDVDFGDTPVERVADPKRDGLRDRITERTAALRGGNGSGEPEASVPTGGAEPEGADRAEGEAREPSGGSPRKGDAWMARLHAVGNERGYDHAALHDWAAPLFKVESLTDLTPKQRGEFMAQVEKMPILGQTCAHPSAKHVVTDTAVTCGECDAVIVQRGSDTRQPVRSGADAATPEAGDSPPVASPPVAPSATVATGDEAAPIGAEPRAVTPAAPTYTPETLRTLAAAVLELDATEDWKLGSLSPHHWDRIFEALMVADDEGYTAWFGRQPREVRQTLMTAHQSPKSRRDAAKAAAKSKPDAEQLKAQIGGES